MVGCSLEGIRFDVHVHRGAVADKFIIRMETAAQVTAEWSGESVLTCGAIDTVLNTELSVSSVSDSIVHENEHTHTHSHMPTHTHYKSIFHMHICNRWVCWGSSIVKGGKKGTKRNSYARVRACLSVCACVCARGCV